MKRLIVHAGAHKTGTTARQAQSIIVDFFAAFGHSIDTADGRAYSRTNVAYDLLPPSSRKQLIIRTIGFFEREFDNWENAPWA